MDQEPVYVVSDRLAAVCDAVLGKIYDIRQCAKEDYVRSRVDQHNAAALRANRYRKYGKWLGVKPQMLITPFGMEQMIAAEIHAMPPQEAMNHPMLAMHRQYGELEHETKDALVQCAINETVLISGPMVRGISHLGLPLDFMCKPKFGFYPRW